MEHIKTTGSLSPLISHLTTSHLSLHYLSPCYLSPLTSLPLISHFTTSHLTTSHLTTSHLSPHYLSPHPLHLISHLTTSHLTPYIFHSQTESGCLENGTYQYKLTRSALCEYMINFIHKLKHLPEKYMMNSVLENFTILQVFTFPIGMIILFIVVIDKILC